jgi:hypothetical protein
MPLFAICFRFLVYQHHFALYVVAAEVDAAASFIVFRNSTKFKDYHSNYHTQWHQLKSVLPLQTLWKAPRRYAVMRTISSLLNSAEIALMKSSLKQLIYRLQYSVFEARTGFV